MNESPTDPAGAAVRDPASEPRRRVVWDLPVRVAHVTFIAAVAGAWLTQGAEHLDLHATFGYAAAIALAFRLAWGFVGSTHARFRDFAYSPLEAWRYLREAVSGRARHFTGHNPAGSWAVWVLLALLAGAVTSGMVETAAMHGLGPFAGLVGFEASRLAHEAHEIFANAILGFAVFHVAGVVWGSRVHRENLAAAMVTGRKLDHAPQTGPATSHAPVGIALAIVLAAFAAIYLGLNVPRDVERREAEQHAALAKVAATPWVKECGGCHLAYTPGLLPARSWERMLVEQDRHFGEDLSLGEATLARLRTAFRGPATWAEWRISGSVAPRESPQRITELRWWRHAHEDVTPAWFKPPFAAGPHECEACHRDAASGIFHPRMIQHPKPRTAT